VFTKTREKSPYFLLAMDFGYTLLAAVVIFGFVGYRLDIRFHSNPWFLLGGIFLGLAIGFNSLFKRLKRLEQRRKAEESKTKPGP